MSRLTPEEKMMIQEWKETRERRDAAKLGKGCTNTFHRLGGIDDCPVCNPDLKKLVADGMHACQTGDCGHFLQAQCEAELAKIKGPAVFDLRCIYVSLFTNMAGQQYYSKRSVDLLIMSYEKHVALRKDHEDDWKRIQDAERALEAASEEVSCLRSVLSEMDAEFEARGYKFDKSCWTQWGRANELAALRKAK